MGEINADLVIGAWPQEGEDFLEGDARAAVISPRLHSREGQTSRDPPRRGTCTLPRRSGTKSWLLPYRRHMMAPVDEGAIPRDSQGHLITNGAGAVEKRKMVNGKEVVMQRFIRTSSRINEFLEALPGDQDFLPYVAQLGLILLEEGQTLLIESEDLTSAFNLFRMPDAWLPYFSYVKKVPGRILGSSEEWVRPALRVISVGWSSAVTIMQAVLRNLVFKKAGIPASLEIAKVKEIPAQGGAVLYLDSFDQVRWWTIYPPRDPGRDRALSTNSSGPRA